MNSDAFIKKLKYANSTVDKYNDLIGEEANRLKREHALEEPSKIQEMIEKFENEDRLLTIGIVGRVKAGKSSLLNALLFDGKDILPKAATPMTASLTQLSYGEHLKAEIDVFTEADIANIKKEHDEYKSCFDNIEKKEFDDIMKKRRFNKEKAEEKSTKIAVRKMKEKTRLSASYDQYNRMKASGITAASKNIAAVIKAEDLKGLSKQLLEYVGAKGKYMPFIKSVHIKLPQENLREIQIIDTPGLNDPVQSREERTRQLLKLCDVVLIVSPSGQFLSRVDLDLMDRITTKEGVRELFVVASQVDTQLFGSEKKKYQGELPKVLNGITATLGEQMSETLKNLKKESPEIGTTFDSLINQGRSKVIHSAGMCQTIRAGFDDIEHLDEGAKTIWNNLKNEYKDYFSDDDKALSLASLDELANISAVEKIVEEARLKKEELIIRKKNDFITTKGNNFKKYKEELANYAKKQVDVVENTSFEEIKEKKSKQTELKKASGAVDVKYAESLDDFETDFRRRADKEISAHFKIVKKSIGDAEGSEAKTYRVKKPLLSRAARAVLLGVFWTEGGYEDKMRPYNTIRTGVVVNAIEDFKGDLENRLDEELNEVKIKWKKDLPKNILSELRLYVSDDDLEPNLIKKVIRQVFEQELVIDMEHSGFKLRAEGVLEGESAEEFITKANAYVRELRKDTKNKVKESLKDFKKRQASVDIAEEIFSNYGKEINELTSQIKEKEITIKRYKKIINEINREW